MLVFDSVYLVECYTVWLSIENHNPLLIFCNGTHPFLQINSFQNNGHKIGSRTSPYWNGTYHRKKKTFSKPGTLFYKGIHIKRHSVHNIYTRTHRIPPVTLSSQHVADTVHSERHCLASCELSTDKSKRYRNYPVKGDV